MDVQVETANFVKAAEERKEKKATTAEWDSSARAVSLYSHGSFIHTPASTLVQMTASRINSNTGRKGGRPMEVGCVRNTQTTRR